ncbi:MAG: hypothetical protein AABY15_07430 [Nanoarchaeota archaeon]
MIGNIYIWSDDSETPFIRYDVIDSNGSLKRYERSKLDEAVPIINGLIDKGYVVNLDQVWGGVEVISIRKDVKKVLLEKLKMKKVLYNRVKNKLLKILEVEGPMENSIE